MSESPSVSSPRRIHSLSKRRAKVSFIDSDDKLSRVGVSQDQSPKPSEVYGFVGSITTVVATGLVDVKRDSKSIKSINRDKMCPAPLYVIFLIWAYLPESFLHYLGFHYYPSKYWALSVPAFAMVIIISALGFYIGLNFIQTPPPTSMNTIFDEYSREPAIYESPTNEEELPIESMYDIGIHHINHLMFSDSDQHSK